MIFMRYRVMAEKPPKKWFPRANVAKGNMSENPMGHWASNKENGVRTGGKAQRPDRFITSLTFTQEIVIARLPQVDQLRFVFCRNK